MARQRDQIDYLCDQWAKVRRELVGLRQPLRASQYIGSIRSTFADVRDHRGGGVAQTNATQFYPELYTGDALLVNRVYKRMPPPLKEIMDLHYVVEEPHSKQLRAEFVGLSRTAYWERVRSAKDRIAGALCVIEK